MIRENTNTKTNTSTHANYFFLSALISFGLIFSYLQFKPHKNLVLRFYDVGQGDSSLVKILPNLSVIIDGGPDSTVLNKLGWDLGPLNRSLAIGILTHEHADHATGLKEVLRYYKTTFLLSSVDLSQNDTYLAGSERVAFAGDTMVLPSWGKNVLIKILWPPKEVKSKNCGQYCFVDPRDLNDTSLVFLLEYGNFKVLYLGDVTSTVLGVLPQTGPVDVVKVPHQGSAGSFLPEFYNKIRPKYAVIPVGKNNYGHPSLELVAFLESLGTKVLTTKDCGDINFEVTTGGEIKVTTKKGDIR